MLTSCTDQLDTERPGTEGGSDTGIGQMVLFTSGTTQNNIATRAGDGDGDGGGDNNSNNDGDGNNGGSNDDGDEPTGVTYYMPQNFRFVCRMYYKAAAGDDANYDVKGGTDVTSWFKVGDNAGNSLYWRNTFADPSNFDVYGNDAEATCFYWQNRKEHAFLAWTDLNRATTIGYSPDKHSGSLKFVPADVDYKKHTGVKQDEWVDNGFQVYGVDHDFADWEKVRTYMEQDDNYNTHVKDKVPEGITPEDYHGKTYYYAFGWSCKYSEAFATETQRVEDPLHKMYGWVQYQMYYNKLKYNGTLPLDGNGIVVKRDEHNKPIFLFDENTNKYLAEIEVQSDAPEDNTKWNYNLTDEYGNVKYDETNPRYTFYYRKLMELRNQEHVDVYPANEFDLTRKPVKNAQGEITSYGINSITEQPDICLALTKQAPLGATQAANRVNLYFKHQFSQIQVNVKSSGDHSVNIGADNITKVELLGVSEKGYVFTEIDEKGKVEPANYEMVDVSKYTNEQLEKNPYGTAFEMFDMATGKDADGNPKTEANKGTFHDAGYPIGYIKACNAIAFGQLQAIRITWKEEGAAILHESTFRVADTTLKNLKSGCKYVWNIELRRGTLAIIRTEIVDWIVNGSDGNSLEYNTNGTISD